jgi:hypothetical protein
MSLALRHPGVGLSSDLVVYVLMFGMRAPQKSHGRSTCWGWELRVEWRSHGFGI